MRQFLLTSFLTVCLAGVASAELPASGIPEMVENRTFGFRVSNPERWQAMKNKTGNLVFLGHPAKPKIDFVTVNVEDLSKSPNVSLETYQAQLLDNLNKSIQNLEIHTDEQDVIDNIPAHQMIYTGTLKGKSMRWKTVFTLKKNRAYVLTYAAEDNDYFEHLESANKIVYSFRFI